MSNKIAKTFRSIADDVQDISSPTFNLDDLNLLQICKNLEKTLNKPSPRTIIFKWLGLGKACLDTDTQRLVLEQINNLGLTVEQLASTKAKLYLSQEMIVNFINGYRAQADLANEEFLTQVKGIQTQRVQYSNLLERETVEIETLRNNNFLERLKTAAEVNLKIADKKYKDSQNEILKIIVDILKKVDINNITPYHVFLAIKGLNPQADAKFDWQMDKVFITEMLDSIKAENRKKSAEAKKSEVQADLEEWDAKEQMKR